MGRGDAEKSVEAAATPHKRRGTSADPIEWYTRFQRYPPALLDPMMRIERGLATISAANLLPAAADQMRASAKAGTVHYSTLIEGNELPLIEAERAARGDLDRESEAKIELINYVSALDFIDGLHNASKLEFTPQFLLDLHGKVMEGLGREDGNFKPHHEGAWRDGVAIIPDNLGRTIHEGADKDEIEGRMVGLCQWVQKGEGNLPEYRPPVLAGIAHYAITDIHPFANGNGRTARLAASAILLKHGYLPGKLFSFEGYYARDRDAYLAALRSVPKNSGNQEGWLAYFLEGMAEEYERVASEVEQLNRVGLTRSATVQLSTTQQKAITKLATSGQRDFTRADYERAAEVSRPAANKDVDSLRKQKLLRVVPGTRGRSTRYTFAEVQGGAGRPRRWTVDRIETELREFTAGREDWPKVKEFTEAGLGSLYQAAVRSGGARSWAERLGLRFPGA